MNSFKLALASFVFMPVLAQAVPVTKCYHKIRFQGEVTNITVVGGADQAEATVVLGNFQHSQKDVYQVKMTESQDLRYVTYKAPGFQMIVDGVNSTASAKVNLNGKTVAIDNLTCDIHTYDPHPGVTMGN